MKFAFNVITDDAKVKLEELGIVFKKEGTATGGLWSVWTEDEDHKEEEWHSRHPGVPIPDELRKEYRAQKTRIWKLHSNVYYYLWRDVVFFMVKDIKLDWRFSPPTQEEYTVLYVVDNDTQSSFREHLVNRPPNANPSEGGVLL